MAPEKCLKSRHGPIALHMAALFRGECCLVFSWFFLLLLSLPVCVSISLGKLIADSPKYVTLGGRDEAREGERAGVRVASSQQSETSTRGPGSRCWPGGGGGLLFSRFRQMMGSLLQRVSSSSSSSSLSHSTSDGCNVHGLRLTLRNKWAEAW